MEGAKRMGNGMPSWEEWNDQLTKEQRDYSLYKILAALHSRLDKIPEKLNELEDKFRQECVNKKELTWLTWGVRSFYGIIVLGLLAYILRGSI